MIRFIDEHKGQFGVESICRVLGAMECGFITSRGYRAAKARPRCARAIRDEVLIDEIRRVHQQNYGVYGQRKMWHAMRREGWMIGRDQTARLMKVAGLHGVRRGRRPFTTVASKLPDHRPDLVERDFHAMAPNELWVADITYVRTVGGFAYTAFITDACTRKIVGWSVASSLTTQALPLIALQQAITTTPAARQGGRLVHHSDRGVQGGFNWLSQHPDREGVWWDEIQRNQRRRRVRVDSGKRIGRSDRSCGRRGIRSTAGMSSQRSGIR